MFTLISFLKTLLFCLGLFQLAFEFYLHLHLLSFEFELHFVSTGFPLFFVLLLSIFDLFIRSHFSSRGTSSSASAIGSTMLLLQLPTSSALFPASNMVCSTLSLGPSTSFTNACRLSRCRATAPQFPFCTMPSVFPLVYSNICNLASASLVSSSMLREFRRRCHCVGNETKEFAMFRNFTFYL